MSWAKRRKKPVVAEGEKKTFDISMMTAVKCSGCGCQLRYTVKKLKKPEWCKECEEKREKHNIPW